MSQQLVCSHCGPRPLEEFSYGEIRQPPAHLNAPERDLDRAYMHDNHAGEVTERWFHALGCRRWSTLRRNTSDDLGASTASSEGDRS